MERQVFIFQPFQIITDIFSIMAYKSYFVAYLANAVVSYGEIYVCCISSCSAQFSGLLLIPLSNANRLLVLNDHKTIVAKQVK